MQIKLTIALVAAAFALASYPVFAADMPVDGTKNFTAPGDAPSYFANETVPASARVANQATFTEVDDTTASEEPVGTDRVSKRASARKSTKHASGKSKGSGGSAHYTKAPPRGKTPFHKMQGLGNDCVVLGGRGTAIAVDAGGACALTNRRTGIGCDQVILLEPPRHPTARVRMRIRNPDGGEAEACGNATRCVAALLHRETGEIRMQIETVAGLLDAKVLPDGCVAVDMGPARTGWREIPLARAMPTDRVELALGALTAPVCTNIGNPHATFFVADVEAIDLAALGPILEHDPLFPERANI